MTNQLIDEKWIVADIFESFPDALPVFLEWKLDCPGCSLSTFCTLEDVARDYHIDLQAFVHALNSTIHPSQTID